MPSPSLMLSKASKSGSSDLSPSSASSSCHDAFQQLIRWECNKWCLALKRSQFTLIAFRVVNAVSLPPRKRRTGFPYAGTRQFFRSEGVGELRSVRWVPMPRWSSDAQLGFKTNPGSSSCVLRCRCCSAASTKVTNGLPLGRYRANFSLSRKWKPPRWL